MIRLRQTFGAHAGRVVEFDKDVVRIGRLPSNDFAFDPHADLDASGNHAEIRREVGGRYVLIDAGSRNGTLIQGRPVNRKFLEGGEEIEFGTGGPRVCVELLLSPAAARSLPTAPATPVLAGESPVSPTAPTAMAEAAVGRANIPPTVTPEVARPNAAAPSEPKLYGKRTVGLMIQSALAEAASSGARPPGPSAGAAGTTPPAGVAQVPSAPGVAFAAAPSAPRSSGARTAVVLGVMLAVFGLGMCCLSSAFVVFWTRG